MKEFQVGWLAVGHWEPSRYLVRMALKRIKSDVDQRTLGHVRFWQEDLQRIALLIREAEHPSEIEIVIDGEYTTNDIADLTAYPKARMKSLAIAGPQVRLSLGSGAADLTMTDPSLQMLGMATQVERIATECRYAGFLFRILGWLGLVEGKGEGAVLVARTKKEAPPWLQRNKDSLVTNAIVSAVFLVIGYIVGKVAA